MELQTKVERIEQRLIETIKDVEKNTTNIERIDKSVGRMEVQFELIMKSLDEVKIDLKALTEARFDDHFRKPIENWSKVKWAIITMIATTAISSFIALFSSFFQAN